MQKGVFADVKIYIFLSILSIILAATDFFNILYLPKSIVQSVTIPIQYGLYKSGLAVKKQFEFIFFAKKILNESKAITEQYAAVLSENATLRKKLAEAESFLQQQTFLSPQTYTMLAARPAGVDRFLLIDKGGNNLLRVGQPVVFKDNLIGIIKNVTPKQSRVMLISDPDSKISAFVTSKNGKAKGVLTGQFGFEMLLDEILHQEPIEKGNLVYSEGTEGNIPRGLILGRVSEVIGSDNDVFKRAKVKPVFDVTSFDVVFVITN